MELVLITVVGLFVLYKVGAFGAALDLFAVATRESSAYNRDHKKKVAKRYLNAEYSFTEEEITKIWNDNKITIKMKFFGDFKISILLILIKFLNILSKFL